MDELLQEILTRPQGRDASKGIGLAIDYFGMMLPCLEESGCNLGVPEGVTDAQWKSALKQASEKLVYSDPSMVIVGGKSGEKSFGTPDVIKTPTPGACADYVTVVTTTSQDRDEDTLHTKGGKLDPRSPLLYQHNPMWPIGKTIAEVGRTDDSLSAHMSIIDNAMGQDAARLAEFGALRTSHGFIAKKFAPKKGKSAGHDIYEFDIVEISLVSVPSNADAVLTEFSRGKLHHPVNKAWGKSLKEALAKSVVSGFQSTKTCDCKGGTPEPKTVPPAQKSVQTPQKSVARLAKAVAEKKDLRVGYDGQCWVDVCLYDSWEWVAEELEEDLKQHLTDSRIPVQTYDKAIVLGTYDSYAVVALAECMGESDATFYSIDWSRAGGDPEFTGTPVEIDVVASVMAEDVAEDQAKSLAKSLSDHVKGRMPKRHVAKLTQARDLMDHVRMAKELTAPTKASADAAHGLVTNVLGQDVKPGEDGGAKSCDEAARELMEIARKGGTLGAGTILALREQIEESEGVLLAAEFASLAD